MYSVRHCQSFARDIQTERLRVIEHLIGGLHDDDLSLYLIQCFNHSTVSLCLCIYTNISYLCFRCLMRVLQINEVLSFTDRNLAAHAH